MSRMTQRDRVELTTLTGGLDAFVEYRNVEPPGGEPSYGENDALWTWDDASSTGVILWLGHSGSQYPQGLEAVTVFLPDGSHLVHAEMGHQVTDEWPAGPGLIVRCEEPFRRWTYRYSGSARPTSATELRQGPIPSDRVSVGLSIEATAMMIAPPWVQGGFFESREEWQDTPGAAYNGGFRYEQPLRTEVTVLVQDGGERRYVISGDGIRTHRKGARLLDGESAKVPPFPGHVWMDATFPSGRGFYVMRSGGKQGDEAAGSDAWVREGDVFHRAELRHPPFFQTTVPGEEHFAFDLESDLGTTHIEGDLVATSFSTMGAVSPDATGIHWDSARPGALALSQSFARYRWGDEVACNMIERSLPISGLTRPPAELVPSQVNG